MMSKTIQKNSKYKLPKIINVLNENDAKQLVRNLKKDGHNGKAILKTKIMIDGERFPLNVSKIEEICKLKQNSKRKTEFIDADFIKLYKQGFTPNDVVSKLKCSFDEADKVFVKFQKYSGLTLTSLEELDTLYSHLHKIDPFVESLDHAIEVVKTAVESYEEFEQYKYPCKDCGKLIRISNGEWRDLYPFIMSNNFSHNDCNNPRYS